MNGVRRAAWSQRPDGSWCRGNRKTDRRQAAPRARPAHPTVHMSFTLPAHVGWVLVQGEQFWRVAPGITVETDRRGVHVAVSGWSTEQVGQRAACFLFQEIVARGRPAFSMDASVDDDERPGRAPQLHHLCWVRDTLVVNRPYANAKTYEGRSTCA